MNKNKKFPIIVAALALILSSCVNNPQKSSIAPSTTSTTSESSQVESSSSIEESSSSEEQSSSSAISSEQSSSQASSEQSSSAASSSAVSSSSSSASSSSVASSSSAVSSSSTASSSSAASSSSSAPSSYVDANWNVNISLRGAEFRNALQTIMAGKKKKTIEYSECLSVGAKAAAYPNASSSTFVPFYHDASTLATTSQCNREHTWPNSRGSGKSGPGADPFIIRPTLTSENSDRGNLFYGSRGKDAKEWDPKSCGFEASRGESARVILYAATMYYKNGLSLSNNPGDDPDLKTMGTLSTLLAWNTTYAPTPIEIQVNNYLSNNGYGRNPFVDHPEFANYIWDNNGLIGDQLPPDDFENALDIENSVSNLDGNEYVIASTDSNVSTTFYVMDNEPKSSERPWYINPLKALINSDKTKLLPDYGVTLKYYKFIKQSDGNYYIQNKENSKYLFAYIDGTHYSIGLGNTPTNNGSLSWAITEASGGGFVFKNAANVYLEYYSSSFCGYKNAPSVPIYLYH